MRPRPEKNLCSLLLALDINYTISKDLAGADGHPKWGVHLLCFVKDFATDDEGIS